MSEPTPPPPRLVVIDSGVDPDHPMIRGRATIVDGPAFDARGIAQANGGALDRTGHGTAVAATIANGSAPFELLSLRVFDEHATCDFASVLHALEYALSRQPSIINLSLGTTSLRYRDALASLAARAQAMQCRLVAPASYGGLPCDPGNLANVDAVVADPNVPPATPELRPHADRWIWFASPLPPTDRDGLRRLQARGDSLACAAVSGCLLRQRQTTPA